MKILNLYAGIGGNRKLWKDVEVTAVELNPDLAAIYQDFFPNDKVIVGDAIEYLTKNFNKFDFIWASPPCPSHSRVRYLGAKSGSYDPILPDFRLYEIIKFLEHYCKNIKWVVENVKPYYEPLLKPQELARHLFWANFNLSTMKSKNHSHNGSMELMQKHKGFDISNYDLSKYKGRRKDQILRNCVEPEVGLHILNMAFKEKQHKLIDN